MTLVVTENCINCKYQDCIEVCPVDCFHEGENFLVIHPDDCIHCGSCLLECPVEAIKVDTDASTEPWLKINRYFAEIWPNTRKKSERSWDPADWRDVPNKMSYLSEKPGKQSD